MNDYLLETRNLATHFMFSDGRVLKAVDGVSLRIRRGMVLGLAGESGSGKSITALSILRLLHPRARIVGGEILFKGQDLLRLSPGEMRRIRGRHISMVLQDPMAALNPVLSVGHHLRNTITAHRPLKARELSAEVVRLLHLVRLPDPKHLLAAHPHELSGGMRQRVAIAMALASGAELIIADEPTTALDVTTQLQILSLFQELRRTAGLSMLFITHDLGVIARICDEVSVMLRGRIVERAPVAELLDHPLHAYTRRLLASIPNPQRKGIPLGLVEPGAAQAEPRLSGNEMVRNIAGQAAEEAGPRLVEVAPDHEVAL